MHFWCTGRCMSMHSSGAYTDGVAHNVTSVYQRWDAAKLQGCVCDS
jgi:hypothetical protein